MTPSRRAGFALALLLAALLLAGTAWLGDGSFDAQGADAPLDERWDPTGSHPLPNPGVDRAP
jgi:hypothetical protein